jgi:hypothetical protein
MQFLLGQPILVAFYNSEEQTIVARDYLLKRVSKTLREPAFNTIALMLTVYVAALVWGIQHVSDRYGPNLLTAFFRRIALWPLVTLVLLLCIAGILLFQPIPSAITALQLPFWAGDAFSFVLLVIAVVVVIVAVYWMVQSLARGAPIISWLRKRKDQDLILEDILLNVIRHSDVQLTREVLGEALRGRSKNQLAMIDWLEDHHLLLSTNWLARELMGVILSSPLDAKAVQIYDDLLCIILAEALDKEEFAHARFVLDTLCDALEKALPWTEEHMNLLSHIGFTLWKIGEYSAWIPRTVKIPEQLKNLQWWFLHRVRSIWHHMLRIKNTDSVYYFTLALCELISQSTGTKDLCASLLSRVYDLLDEGYHENVLKAETLQDLVNELGQLRYELPDGEGEDTQKEIDSYMLAALAILVELGEKEETLGRTASNGYMLHRITKGKRLGTYKFRSEPYYFPWLSPESYTAARQALGLPGLSRKQVDELIDRKAATRPIDIQVEREPITDDTSHLSLGSSSETPILLKVPRFTNGRGSDNLR